MNPQEIKKKYFIEVENQLNKCVYCKQTYKENMTRIFNIVRMFLRSLIRQQLGKLELI